MFGPGYYKSNLRALRLRETIRWYGWWRGLWSWLKSRIMGTSRKGLWMPGLWEENECTAGELSQCFWDVTRRHRADFERLGFVQCRLSKVQKTLDVMARDSGTIFYLDPSRCYFGRLTYSQHYVPAKRKIFIQIGVAFTAVFENGSFSCTNIRLTFDSASDGEVIRMKSNDPTLIYNRFREELQRRGDKPQPFADVCALRQWFDARQIKNFEDHVRRRLFIRMTETEIEAAKAEMQRYGPGRGLPPSSRRFRLNPVTTTFVLLSVVSVVTQLHRQRPAGPTGISGNTIEYHGQQFKMRLPYDSYEDYQDDPNNLDTNDLSRIEQTMEAVKIPISFKDSRTFLHFMIFDLKFPGYGLGGIGANIQANDGTTFAAEFVEIPQAGKDRVIIVRSKVDGGLTLADDFIFESGETNSFSRVQLEHGQLEYFDQQGRLVRKKTI
ncbi:MAG TPA: hypothetical protein VH280_01275 [Verrucomicrobiae bacterium]|jgi:hypothetical protein|nr:hypothetical protein [Verrucomicrobiae bacterium]